MDSNALPKSQVDRILGHQLADTSLPFYFLRNEPRERGSVLLKKRSAGSSGQLLSMQSMQRAIGVGSSASVTTLRLLDRNRMHDSMERQLEGCLMQIIRIVNEKKDHIPPIVTNEANPFPYQVGI